MNSRLLAFNVAQDVPTSAVEATDAHYDAQEQRWIGGGKADYKAYASASVTGNDRRANMDGYIQDGYIQDGYTKNDMCG